MAIYRFRVAFEDQEDVYRDIEIRSSQTFEEFHTVILSSIGFDKKHAASFFVCDSQWRKGTEVTLLEEDLEDGVRWMKKTKIAACVEDPYQYFMYIYDKNVSWSFTVQLIKIIKEEGNGDYPLCIKSFGTAPKQYKPVTGAKEDVIPLEPGVVNLISELEDEEAYRHAGEKPEEILDEEDAAGLSNEGDNEEENESEFDSEESDEENEEGSGFSGYQDDEH